jgi:hypothetical protein
MTAGEVLAAVVLSVAAIWLWSQVVGFFLTAGFAAARAFWGTRIEFRGPTVEDVRADPKGVGGLFRDSAGNVCTTTSGAIETIITADNSGFKAEAERIEKKIRDATTLPGSLVRDPLGDLIREAGRIPDALAFRPDMPYSVGFRGRSPFEDAARAYSRPRRRTQLVERLALDVGEDEPVFCSWPAGRQTITLPTRGGEPMILVRTNECILDDGTDRLAVVYRIKPE